MKQKEPIPDMELSILIPVHNEDCVERVAALKRQCDAIDDFRYEIIVMDDGSTSAETVEADRAIISMEHCRLVERSVNRGSAATRNELADISRYRWLLFLDSDMDIPESDFIRRYAGMMSEEAVVNGGIAIAECPELEHGNLRYMYERAEEARHTAADRRRRPYQSFRSTNFMIPKAWMSDCRFDAAKAGYEDVFFGRMLKEQGRKIIHIDNPTLMRRFEENPRYMDKIDHSLDVLYDHRADFRGYSRLITYVNELRHVMPLSLVRLWHRVMGRWERRRLAGHHPGLLLFRLYQLGYYVSKME